MCFTVIMNNQLEIDRYGFLGADTSADISANYGLIADTDISKIFKSCFLLHDQNNVFYALPFFEKLQKSGFMRWNFSNCSNFNILPRFLIYLINDDNFVSAVTANVCSMVHPVCLFMKTLLLALLQYNCLDLVCCAFLCKLSTCVRNIIGM